MRALVARSAKLQGIVLARVLLDCDYGRPEIVELLNRQTINAWQTFVNVIATDALLHKGTDSAISVLAVAACSYDYRLGPSQTGEVRRQALATVTEPVKLPLELEAQISDIIARVTKLITDTEAKDLLVMKAVLRIMWLWYCSRNNSLLEHTT